MYWLSSSCFAKGGTEAQVWGFSLAGRFGSAICVCSPVISQVLLLPLLSGAHRELATGSGAIRGGGILSAMAQMLKNLPATQETWVWALGQEDPLEEEMATHSNILPGRIPWTQEPSGYSPWGCRVGHDWATKHSTAYAEHCRWGIPCSFRTSFLSEVSWTRVPSMPWGGYLPSPSLPASQSCSPCFRTPDVGRQKWASLAASRMDWEATCHPQALPFPERNCRISLLALSWVPLGAGWCTPSEAAPLALSEHPNSVLGSKGRLKRLFWKPGLLKGSLVCGWLL